MKWFKHFSDASNDEFISDLEDEFGLIGYGRWWKLLESIAAQMEAGSNKCSASYSEKKWCRKLQCKPKVLVRFLECTDNAGKTKTERNGNILEISCCKLLELRDNHSKNLQVDRKQLVPDLPLEVDVEVEVEKTIKENYKGDFESLWKQYPKKDGKKEAERHFFASVKSMEDEDNIILALKNYCVMVQDTERQYIKNGSTWFNNWQDFIEVEDLQQDEYDWVK